MCSKNIQKQLEDLLGELQRVPALPGVHPKLSQLVPIYGRGLLEERDDPRLERSRRPSPDPKFKGGLAQRRDLVDWTAN
jgi:hypothetical protein